MPQGKFQKPALDIAGQIALLRQRGMQIPDQDRAQYFLQFIGYYRLSGYWVPFQYRDGSGNHDNFRAGTDFDAVLGCYIFDRQLRLLIMDALERIEVAVRSLISNRLSVRHGPHWYLNRACFSKAGQQAKFEQRVREAVLKNKNAVFLQHYQEHYSLPELPPSWMIFEILTFGDVSNLFVTLPKEESRYIANQLGLPLKRLVSWLHALAYLRNLCAHHSRVWNRSFAIKPSPAPEIRQESLQLDRFYLHAVVMQILLKKISREPEWTDRLAALFKAHPAMPLAAMGFPENWPACPVWR